MSKQSRHDLHAQRPVRSDFARRGGGGGINPFKLALLFGAALAVLGGGYAAMTVVGHAPTTDGEIPTIEAELPIKQRPEQPGGIDIPHQDVAVFQKLDSKGAATSQQQQQPVVEHLLPEPETPDMKTAEVKTAGPLVAPEGEPLEPAVTEKVDSAAAKTVPSVSRESVDELPPPVTEAQPPEASPVSETPAPRPETVKAAAKPVEKPKAETVAKAKTAEKTTAKVIESKPVESKAGGETGRLPTELFTQMDYTPPAVKAEEKVTETVAVKVKEAAATETTASGGTKKVQLASYPDKASAEKEVKRLQSKYASLLGGAKLSIVPADLGSKGTYYRVLSTSMPESKAKAVCAAVVTQKGSCMVK
ncbi:MAG: SPOR domain-containing protein [Alphaproteobacteria bacterium]|nr:SPOR domain-containing protein [Alphaproteobacteria bacterium]